jgi:cytochrome oxidase Cu insertion factor (SCO1/SenC/PrrC family)
MGIPFDFRNWRGLAAGGLVPSVWATATLSRKVFGSIFAVLAFLLFAFFCYETLYVLKQVPLSAQAPRIGEKAPEFTLPDQNGKQIALTDLLSPNGAILIFYRGYW